MRTTMAVLAAIAMSAFPLHAAEAPTHADIRQQFYQVTNDIRRAVDKMPEADYDFRPARGMRSFRELVAHIAEVQNDLCSAVFNDRKASFAKPKTTSKADMADTLGQSFTACYQAFAELSPENAAAKVKTPVGDQTRLGALVMVVAHNNEEYGYMAVYLRLKGLVPPSSDPQPAGGVKETAAPRVQ
jgi:uncharacterized damage-inducible protein DinB